METAVKLADIYLRLSVEEANRGESSSITNQRNIIQQYCEDNNIIIVREFIDDGYSGSNFNRPGFQEMLSHIDTGQVNMVITKDLSRLGRDMTESSHYAEKYFPEHGIHYVAISDSFNSDDVNLMAPFQFAMNDVYLRDTSRKIKQVINHKRQKGEYCSCPPFGYMKNPKDKTVLVPDPETAPIVQYIFKLAIHGESAHSIADILTQEGYITPLKYRVLYRDNFCDKGAERATDIWNHTTVKRILVNQVYLGHTILGKSKKASLKSKKKVALPKEEWCITKNTHTPLITEEEFEKVKYYMGMHTKDWRKCDNVRKNIFKGVIFCENCHAAMCSGGGSYKGDRYWYLICNNVSKEPSKKCSHKARINYNDLIELVIKELNQLIDLSDNEINNIIKSALDKHNENNVFDNKEMQIESIEKRIKNIDNIIIKLYHDNIAGIIDDDRLTQMIKSLTTESKTLKQRMSEILNQESVSNRIIDSYNTFFKLAKSYTHIETLTEEIVRTFIEKIEIGEKILSPGFQVATHSSVPFTQNIKITYRFIGNLNSNDIDLPKSCIDEKLVG